MAITVTKGIGDLKTLFNQIKDVYYLDTPIDAATGLATITADLELPVIEDSVSFNTGDIEKTEVKLTTGTIWASKITKGDSDITMQVSSVDDDINSLFITKKNGSTPITADGSAYTGNSYDLDAKVATGALIFLSADGKGMIVLPNVDMSGALVLGDGDNPSYFNVTVTPKINAAGVSIYILKKAS